LKFIFGKESLEKKTSIKNETKVNSVSFLDYRFALAVLFISILSMSGIVLSASASATDIPTTVNIKPSLSISLPSNTISIPLDPSGNDFGASNTTITVATNNPNGYKLYLSSNSTDLTNTTNSSYKIPTLESSSSEAGFPANRWGYKLNADTDYSSYESNTLLSESQGATNGVSSTITLAAKVDYTKPAGLYSLAFDLKTIPIVTQTYMQNMDPSVCTETPTIVIDNRDEQPYLIQRLADHKCWMLDNLNLDLTNRTIAEGLTAQNTNATDTALNYLRNGGGESSDQWAINGLTYQNWTTEANSRTAPLINKSGTCSRETNYPCTYNGSYTNNTVISTLTQNPDLTPDPSKSNFGPGSGKIGVYYNYCAATAGSYCYTGSGAGTPPANTDASQDLCPTSWRIPNGRSNNEFLSLCTAVKGGTCSATVNMMDADNQNSMQYKLSITLSGFYLGAMPNRQGTRGAYVTSGYYSASQMYVFMPYINYTSPAAYDGREHGQSIRCLLNES
ncbi:hypothetical protein IKF23_00865, partial [Candidatus Saccharibacteria bacterium]|nr:hypothetical protein [Candidatus Saccharibacteria bacterium]